MRKLGLRRRSGFVDGYVGHHVFKCLKLAVHCILRATEERLSKSLEFLVHRVHSLLHGRKILRRVQRRYEIFGHKEELMRVFRQEVDRLCREIREYFRLEITQYLLVQCACPPYKLATLYEGICQL